MPSRNEEGVLYGSRHEHNLCLEEGLPRYKCSGCKAFGVNIGFKCRSCPDFVLHNDCAVLPDEYAHPFFREHPFQFRPEASWGSHCDGCGKKLRGFVFKSRGAHLKLHPLCMALPTAFSYSGHYHDLELVTEKEETYSCTQCNKQNRKWKYRCEIITCNVKMDMNCAIVNYLGLSSHGINQLQPPTRSSHTLGKLSSAVKFVWNKAGNIIVSAFAGLAVQPVYQKVSEKISEKKRRKKEIEAARKKEPDHP